MGWKLTLKTTEDDQEEEEASANRAAAEETSADGAIGTVLSERDGVFAFKEEQKQHWRLSSVFIPVWV